MLIFFFNDPATTEIYTLSLHDALPISRDRGCDAAPSSPDGTATHPSAPARRAAPARRRAGPDRKSTRLNSSHPSISYAVFCLKKKKAVLRGGLQHDTARRPARSAVPGP